jgi:cytochrome b
MPTHTIRIWDLPTRLFHWLLAASVVALVVTAKVGGNAMVWHFRLGYVVLALLAFRLVWGLVGGRWSRFASFVPTPGRLWRYLRGSSAEAESAGHSPLGALSVLALLGVLIAQVVSGLLSDDEIAFSGPLTRFVSGEWVGRATWFHADVGQYLVIGLVALHLLAIAYYTLVRRKILVRPMLHGDKLLTRQAPASRDDVAARTGAAVVAVLSAALAWWISGLGAG